MALFDIFKKKKEETKKPKKKEVKVKAEKKPKALDKKKSDKVKKTSVSKERAPGFAYRILKQPHITEKATDLAGKNKYVFRVWPNANKIEIKRAVQNLYGVGVLNVRIVNIPPKKRKLGKIEGQRKGYKKAIVKVKEGQKIELMPR
ncbi:MAG TPA: 50S ribosomal protein L23 [Candidatus Parcubacteria bacterium]|jgi:large subunit ribosomal protein L23|nr:50S ribosomal protein L23 [Candidatus Parcubacteria bacterium]|tara:strand:+ start:82 stop:519 length:438 start_codon:yes stop_codon:yes gene_type:complete